MTLLEQVADKLRQIKGDMTYAELEKMSGVDGAYLSRLMKGERNLGLGTLEQIAKDLGYEVELKFKRLPYKNGDKSLKTTQKTSPE